MTTARIESGCLLVGPFLAVSFQRYPRPAEGALTFRPTSFGALPVAMTSAGEFYVPLDEVEALWLGFSASRTSAAVLVRVAVETVAHGVVDAVSGLAWSEASLVGLVVPPARGIDGIARPDGNVWPFTRVSPVPDVPACTVVHLVVIPPRRRYRTQAAPGREPVPYHGSNDAQGLEPEKPLVPASGDATFWRVGRAVRVRIRLVDGLTFAANTGQSPPPPIDPAARYGGWRLP